MNVANTSPLASMFAGASNRTATSGNAPPGQADFLKLLVAQLQNQDPLNPTSGTDFTSQLAQFSTLQGIQQLNANFSNLLLMQGLSQATTLIGKTVTYTKPNTSQTSQGVVQAVSVNGGNIQLVIGGNNVALSQVQSITAGKA
jgi:flagellar basal-body rod modification protein FlgD